MCYLFGKLIFKSYINESLDFEETRIMKILQVLDNQVEIEISGSPNISDNPETFLNPECAKNTKTSKKTESRIFKIRFNDFENLLKTNSELCVIDDSISKIFLKDLSVLNPKFSYTYSKEFKGNLKEFKVVKKSKYSYNK